MLTDAQLKQRLGRMLVRYRRHAGQTQRELAARLGIPHGTLGRFERGEQWPSPTLLAALLDECRLNPSELFEDTRRPRRRPRSRNGVSA